MNIFVLVNQTFDTEEYVVIQDGVLSEEGVKWILNPFAPDESHVSAITSQERLAGNTVRVHRDAGGIRSWSKWSSRPYLRRSKA